MAKTARYMTAVEVEALLAKRYSAPEYAFLTQVRNGTGYGRRKTRTADGLAFSLWPSRGISLTGIEIKVSRSDWKAELADPSKADEICKFCDYWYLAVSDETIVEAGELPELWGLLVANGKAMKCIKEAPKQEAKTLDMLMICSIMRNVNESMVPASEVNPRIMAAREEGKQTAEQLGGYELKSLREKIKAFEEASGVSLGNSWECGEIGTAVKMVRKHGVHQCIRAASRLRDTAESITKRLDEALDGMRQDAGTDWEPMLADE